jgi:hypothetical protein
VGAPADFSHRHEVHLIHVRPPVVPLSPRQYKMRRLREKKAEVEGQMGVLKGMLQRGGGYEGVVACQLKVLH